MAKWQPFKMVSMISLVLIFVFVAAGSVAAVEQSLYARLLFSDEKLRVAAVKELHETFNTMSSEQKKQLFTELILATAQVGTKDGSQPYNSGKAMTALAEIGTPAVPFFIQYLEQDLNPNPSDFPAYLSDLSPASLRVLTRGLTITVLGRIRPPAIEAVPLLVKILREEKNPSAAQALGEIGVATPEVINAIQEVLQGADDRLSVMILTAEALRKLGVKPQPRQEMIGELFEQLQGKNVLENPNEIYSQMDVAHALLLLGAHKKESIQVLLDGMDKIPGTKVIEIIRELGPIAKETVPKLVEKLHEEYYPVAIIEALRCIGTPEALKAVNEYEQQVKIK